MAPRIGRSTGRDAEPSRRRKFALSLTPDFEIMNVGQQLDLRPGELVEARGEAEILATLDDDATLDGLPFMPEMLAYCGRQYRVYKRADKTCDAVSAERGLTLFRRMERTVHLVMLRCDGSAHGGCQAGCLMFWKEAWLRRSSERHEPISAAHDAAGARNGEVPTVRDRAWLQATACRTLTNAGETRYRCQATELHKASCPLAFWEPRQYVNDVRVNNVPFSQLVRGLLFPILGALRMRLTGRQLPDVSGTLTRTPTEVLDLQPGEWVVVKSKEEIRATLDKAGRNRGLTFEIEMLPYCGKRFRVLRRVTRIMEESSGRVKDLAGVSVILEDVICASYYRRSCPRSNLLYWREIWLRRAKPDEIPQQTETNTASV